MRIIISGGGTGGHIFPAIAIANALKARNKNNEILFVGAKDRMEMQKVPAAGYQIEGLWISGIQRKLTLDNLSFPFKLLSSIQKSKKIIKQFKPDIAIGVGGFASGPLLYQASKMKVPTLIQEQNSHAGLTNRWLSKRVDKICVAYENMERFFPSYKIVYTGNPVREDILNLENKKQEALDFFGLKPDKKIIFAVGGSLGARTINQSLAKDLKKLQEADIQLVWQTGKSFKEQGEVIKKQLPNSQIQLHEFINRMDLAYAMADVVISRAGALAISELCIVRKPCIFVPFPYAAEDHQTMNALALVKENAALYVKDSEAENKLVDIALDLIKDEIKQKEMQTNILSFAKPDATQTILEEVLALVEKK